MKQRKGNEMFRKVAGNDTYLLKGSLLFYYEIS